MPIGPAIFGKISEKTYIVRFIDAKTKLAINNTSSLHCRLGWFKNAFSSETDKIMLGTTFSHYLGIKQCRKPKIENFYTFFHPVQALRSFTT